MSVRASCYPLEVLRQYVTGKLPDEVAPPLEEHLLTCDACASSVNRLADEDTLTEAIQSRSTTLEEADQPRIASLIGRLSQLRQSSKQDSAQPQQTLSYAGESGEHPKSPGTLDFLSPPESPDEMGRLGSYRVLDLLGEGGMGMVFRAEDLTLKRTVALKVMKPEAAQKPGASERFLREAQTAGQIDHDHIVTIFQVGEENGVPYLAMQWLQGMSLRDRLHRPEPLSVAQILRLGKQIAKGLQAAHAQSLIHRDIKPDNLWIEPEDAGRIKILDFGLARSIEEDVQITQSGMILGTPAFMAPEQARGEKVDARVDLFSFGVVLYQLCTSRLPFTGNSTMAVLTSLAVDEPPPIRELNPSIPEELAELVHQLLAKKPDDRPATAAVVARRLGKMDARTSAEVSAILPAPAPPEKPEPQPKTVQEKPSSTPTAVVESTSPVQPRRRSLVLRMVALLLVLGVVVAGIVVIIKDKDGNKLAEVNVPEGGRVEIKGRPEKDKKTKSPEKDGKPSPSEKDENAVSRDREVMQRLLSQGNHLRVSSDSGSKWVPAYEVLPTDATKILMLKTDADSRFGKDDLASLPPANILTFVDLGGKLTDGDLDELGRLTNLKSLGLKSERITDRGMASLQGLSNLEMLAVQGPKVGDEGLKQLAKYSRLQKLYVGGPTVTDTGLLHVSHLNDLENLGVHGSVLSDKGLAHLEKLAELTCLFFVDVQFHDVDGSEFQRFPGLTILELIRCNLGDECLEQLVRLPKLQALYVDGSKCTDKGLQYLPLYPSLRELRVGCAGVTDAGLGHVGKLSNLTKLGLNGADVSDRGLEHLVNLPNLRELSLFDTKVTGSGVSRLNQALPECKIFWNSSPSPLTKVAQWALSIERRVQVKEAGELRWIDDLKEFPTGEFQLVGMSLGPMRYGPLSPVGDMDLLRLKPCTDLVHLTLWESHVSDAGVAHLQGNTKLEHLELGRTLVSSFGLADLAPLNQLKYLGLQSTKVTDYGLRQLANLSQLQTLDLNHTEVTDAGLQHLHGLKQLTTVYLRDTGVSPNGVAQLQKALPGCKLVWDEEQGPDRHLAERLLASGNEVRIEGGNGGWIPPFGTLPEGPIHIRGIRTNADSRLEGRDLAELSEPEEAILVVDFGGKLTDADLDHIAKLHGLKILVLKSNRITEKAIDRIASLQNLWNLGLQDGVLGDAGLQQLEKHPMLESLYIGGPEVTDTGLAYLSGLSKLDHLGIHSATLSDKGLTHLAKLKNLTHLFFGSIRFREVDGSVFLEYPSLTTLVLGECTIGEEALGYIVKLPKLSFLTLKDTKCTNEDLRLLGASSSLRELDLGGTDISDEGLVHLGKLPQLTALYLNRTSVSDAGLKHLTSLSNLRGLQLMDTKVTKDGVTELQKALPMCKIFWNRWQGPAFDLAHWVFSVGGRVQVVEGETTQWVERLRAIEGDEFQVRGISLGPWHFGPKGPIENAHLQNLARSTDLVHLNLWETYVSDLGLAHLKGLTKLEHLELGRTLVSSFGLADLAPLNQLKYLGLQSTNVSDYGLRQLGKLSQLERLDLNDTDVTDVGLKHLYALKRLTTVYLRETRVSPQGLAQLQKALPTCKLVWDEEISPDRQLAEWLREKGNDVDIETSQGTVRVLNHEALPDDFLRLLSVRTNADSRLDGNDIESLAKTASVRRLFDHSARLVDSDLVGLNRLPNLGLLVLQSDRVTDASMSHIKGLTNLWMLNLWGTSISEAGLKQLDALSQLRLLFLEGPQITDGVTDGVMLRISKITTLKELGIRRTTLNKEGSGCISHLKNLHKLFLDDVQFNDLDENYLAGLTMLNTLQISDCNDGDKVLSQLGRLPSLNRLLLDRSGCTDRGLQAIPEHHKLTTLGLSGSEITNAGLMHLERVPNLTSLNVSGTRVNDEGLHHLAVLSKLTDLSLIDTKVTSAGVSKLQRVLPNCTITWEKNPSPKFAQAEWVLTRRGRVRIRNGEETQWIESKASIPAESFDIVGVSFCPWRLATGKPIENEECQQLSKYPSLTYLNMWETTVSDVGLPHLKVLTKLEHLELGRTQVSNTGLEYLTPFANLSYLGLQGTKVSDEGLPHLKVLTKLTALDLNHTAISDVGLPHLHGLTSLQHLYVKKTKVTPVGLAALQKALPECKIHWDEE